MYQKVFGFDRYNIDVGGCEVDGFALQQQDTCNYACCVGIGCEDWAASTEVVIWEIRWAGECGAWAG